MRTTGVESRWPPPPERDSAHLVARVKLRSKTRRRLDSSLALPSSMRNTISTCPSSALQARRSAFPRLCATPAGIKKRPPFTLPELKFW